MRTLYRSGFLLTEDISWLVRSNSQSDNNSGDHLKEQVGQIQKKADEATKFLIVDVSNAREELARNWGWIVASGVLTMALGTLAFTMPVFATGVAYDATVLTVGLSGVVSLISTFLAENGHKVKSGISGVLYMALAYYMSTKPAQGLDIITLSIASVIALEGFYETALALKNKDIQGRPWHFFSGVGSVLASAWLSTNIPATSLVVPGAALGTRLTSNGARKVATGLAGKELADNRK